MSLDEEATLNVMAGKIQILENQQDNKKEGRKIKLIKVEEDPAGSSSIFKKINMFTSEKMVNKMFRNS